MSICHSFNAGMLVVFLGLLTFNQGCKSMQPKGVLRSYSYQMSAGTCLAVEYAEPVSEDEVHEKGSCPTKSVINEQAVKVLKRCRSFKSNDKNEYQWMIYDRFIGEDGSIRGRTSDEAAAYCDRTEGQRVANRG